MLVLCLAASLATSTLAAAAGWLLAGLFPAAAWPAAIALLLAAAQLARPIPPETAREPTRSLFATAWVLVMRQALDAPRWIILAVAASGGAPLHAALGGAVGAGAALALGWAMGPRSEGALPGARYPWRSARLALAGLAATAAAAVLLP